MKRVYLDHAASTPLDERVLEAMLPYLQGYTGNPSSTHAHGRQLKTAIEQSRRTIADLLSVSPSEIVFTSGGTESDNTALKSGVCGTDAQRVITSPLEHHAVLHPAEYLAERGHAELVELSADRQGRIDLTELETLLADGPKTLVSLMHANNEIGVINDVEAIGRLCRDHGALFHSDTVQSIAVEELNFSELPFHYATASAHKFNGPPGVGLLYVEGGHALPPHIHGGAQERDQRGGTENLAGIVGMAKALELTYAELDNKRQKLLHLQQLLIRELRRNFEGLHFNSPTEPGEGMPSTVNVALPGSHEDGDMLLINLDIRGISASGGSACTSGSVKPSHVLSALGLDDRQLINSVRFSLGPSNTEEDIVYLIGVLRELLPAEACKDVSLATD